MRCGHLFNGIGGFALAASWMGWENVFHCEIDGYCNKVMKRHFPNSIEHEDIKQQDFSSYRGAIDLLTGGFPCQPYSTAGKRLGKADERHLWPEMLRAIQEIRPRWLVGENVRGLTNWNGGVVFDEVQADLETEGYEVLPFLLPAAGVQAPHGRQRIWFVAHSVSHDARGCGYEQIGCASDGLQSPEEERQWIRTIPKRVGEKRVATHPEFRGLPERYDESDGRRPQSVIERSHGIRGWENFPIVPGVCGGNDGIPNRVDRIAALGNAIVPQVVLQIFRAIESYEKVA